MQDNRAPTKPMIRKTCFNIFAFLILLSFQSISPPQFFCKILLQNSFAKLFSLIFTLRRSSQTIHGKFFCKNFHAKFFCKILIAKSSLTNDLFAPLHQQTVSNASNHKIQNQTQRHSNRRFLNCNSHKSFFLQNV